MHMWRVSGCSTAGWTTTATHLLLQRELGKARQLVQERGLGVGVLGAHGEEEPGQHDGEGGGAARLGDEVALHLLVLLEVEVQAHQVGQLQVEQHSTGSGSTP